MRRVLLLCCLAIALPASAGDSFHVANLDGLEEVPPTASAGSGFAVATVVDAGTRLRVAYTWRDLGSGLLSAHIHGPAAPGVNAAVVFNLTPPTGATSGEVLEREFDLDATRRSQLAQGLLYVNLHSPNFPGGEIRGQLLPAPVTTANLRGAQEVPAVASPASGRGQAVVDEAGGLMWVALEWAGLLGTTTAAHIHGPADRGTNAAVLFNLAPPTGTGSGRVTRFFPVDAQDTGELAGGQWYFNVHSTQFGGGEVRGQLDIVQHDGFEP